MVATAYDDFNRANAASLGTSSSGHTWAVTSGTWTIASNAAHPPTGLSNYTAATLDDGATVDAIIEVTLTSTSGRDFDGGPIGRFVDINNFIFMDISRVGTDYLTRTFQRVGGSFSGLTSLVNPVSGVPQGTPFVARMELVGDGGEVFINGVSMGTFSGVNAALLSSTKHGVIFSASDAVQLIDIEDFSIDNGSAGGSTVTGTLLSAFTATTPMMGTPRKLGQLTLPVTVTTPMVGTRKRPGQLITAVTATTPLVGTPRKLGQLVTAETFTAPLIGTPKVFGVLAPSTAFSAPLTGVPRVLATLTGGSTFSATALGSVTDVATPGTIATTFTFGATALGTPKVSGSSTTTVTFGATMRGEPFTPVSGIVGRLSGPGASLIVGSASGASSSGGMPGRMVGR